MIIVDLLVPLAIHVVVLSGISVVGVGIHVDIVVVRVLSRVSFSVIRSELL
jgi:hypothetical protein